MPSHFLSRLVGALTFLLLAARFAAADDNRPISFYKEIRPILQAKCQGCHQPAKRGGEYLLTEFDRLLKGGESQQAAVVPGKPNESHLVQQITPKNGKADMPKGKDPLNVSEIDLIRGWIAQGAKNDSPSQVRYDEKNPPKYSRSPVGTALAWSPDGNTLAVSGHYEVLLHDASVLNAMDPAANSEPVSQPPRERLIGLAERIESLAFSPDGKRLAVTGGVPTQMGELQVWDLAEGKSKLAFSVAIGFDSVYGVSWSPDGKFVACGCSDNSVRVIDATTGVETFSAVPHTDWVLDTVFSEDGKQLVTVSRDGSAKIVEVESRRLLGGLTGVQPGALKGELYAVVLDPNTKKIVAAGNLGKPRRYRLDVQANGTLDGELPELPGPIFDMAWNVPLQRMVAVGGLGDDGRIAVYDNGGKQLAQIKGIDPQYAVAFSPDGKRLVATGRDGVIRCFDSDKGQLVQALIPVALQPGIGSARWSLAAGKLPVTATVPEKANEVTSNIAKLEVSPATIDLQHPYDYRQLLLTAVTTNDERIDVTRTAQRIAPPPFVHLSPTGLVRPVANGRGELKFQVANQQISIPVVVAGLESPHAIDFVTEVQPVLSKLGCNAGTCHGAKDGKNGFKLSLRGYDPQFDRQMLTGELRARRTNLAAPERSLMLLKPSGILPHTGGVLAPPGSPAYELIREWIAQGAKLHSHDSQGGSPRVVSLQLLPVNPIVPRPDMRQQITVMATYSDGRVRDVTAEAAVSTGNLEVAKLEGDGLATALRRGEAALLARYEGAYASTILTVMGDRAGFAWKQLPVYNYIDEHVDRKLQRVRVLPSDLCTDDEFLRRVSLDLIGLPPSANEVRQFLADPQPSQKKREALIDRLIGSEEFVEHWTNKWCDLLMVNSRFLGKQGVFVFRDWIRQAVASNTPYDQFANTILTASGSPFLNPPAAYFSVHKDAAELMENTTHLFLSTRFNCNKCHDHPFERWTQDQYYELSAYFAQIGRKKDRYALPSGGKVDVVFDQPTGDVTHLRTGKVAPPQLPYQRDLAESTTSRRQQLAAWITSPKNHYFARSQANRLWGYLFGVGIIEPIDDIRAGNPATNPELLDALTQDFVAHKFDVQHLLRTICRSRTYQLSVATNRWNDDDQINYSHAIPKRLPAEVLYDMLHRAVGLDVQLPGLPAGFRAASLPDSEVDVPFLKDLGRPLRDSACECERSTGLVLGPILKLVNGPTVNNLLTNPGSAIAKLATVDKDEQIVEELFVRFLGRRPTPDETQIGVRTLHRAERTLAARETTLHDEQAKLPPPLAEAFALPPKSRSAAQQEALAAHYQTSKSNLDDLQTEIATLKQQLPNQRLTGIQDLAWALLNSPAFLFNR